MLRCFWTDYCRISKFTSLLFKWGELSGPCRPLHTCPIKSMHSHNKNSSLCMYKVTDKLFSISSAWRSISVRSCNIFQTAWNFCAIGWYTRFSLWVYVLLEVEHWWSASSALLHGRKDVWFVRIYTVTMPCSLVECRSMTFENWVRDYHHC